jgi:hypothetical protein
VDSTILQHSAALYRSDFYYHFFLCVQLHVDGKSVTKIWWIVFGKDPTMSRNEHEHVSKIQEDFFFSLICNMSLASISITCSLHSHNINWLIMNHLVKS